MRLRHSRWFSISKKLIWISVLGKRCMQLLRVEFHFLGLIGRKDHFWRFSRTTGWVKIWEHYSAVFISRWQDMKSVDAGSKTPKCIPCLFFLQFAALVEADKCRRIAVIMRYFDSCALLHLPPFFHLFLFRLVGASEGRMKLRLHNPIWGEMRNIGRNWRRLSRLLKRTAIFEHQNMSAVDVISLSITVRKRV